MTFLFIKIITVYESMSFRHKQLGQHFKKKETKTQFGPGLALNHLM